MNVKFRGALTAMITPFVEEKVDENNLRRFIQWQIAEGIDGLVPCGTTGESPVLNEEEQDRVIRLTVETAEGKIPIIAGAGTNDTRKSVQLGKAAKKAGADALLVIVPYYNKPNPEGQYLHFKMLHDEVGLPIVIYNNPGRTIIDMPVEIMARLAELPNIVGVKDATADLARPVQTRLAISKSFSQLSGDDATSLPFLAVGGHGCISVTANIAPRLCGDMQREYAAGNLQNASRIHDRLLPLHKLLFVENSPAPVKYGTHLLGYGAPDVRLPLAPISEGLKVKIETAMRHAGLMN